MRKEEQPWNVTRFKGTGSWDGITLSAAAVVDGWLNRSTKKVKLTCAANHNLTAGSAITINGTDNYDGTWLTLSGTAAKLIYIDAAYVAETTATGDTCKFTIAPGHPWELGGFRITLNASSATSENLTVTVDSGAGSVYDHRLLAYDMDTVQYLAWYPPMILIDDSSPVANYNSGFVPIEFGKDDEVDFAWANSNSKTYGLEVFWRRIS